MLQMVLEPDTERCVSEEGWPSREVKCEIPHRSKRGAKHSL